MWELVEDVESMDWPVRDHQQDGPRFYESDSGSNVSATSHEFGRCLEEDAEESSVVSDLEEPETDAFQATFISQVGALGSMPKGTKRKARHHVKEIKEAMTCAKPPVPRPFPRPEVLPPRRQYKVLP